MRRRGMALMLVLTVSSVLVMMTGAFVANNHANFTTLAATQRQREALLAVESASSYLYHRLEHDKTFAQSAFAKANDISPPGGGLKVRQIKGTTQIEGTLVDEAGVGREATFVVEIHNRLDLPATNHPVRVPKDAVLMKVVGRSGGFESRCDILYQGEPLYDGSLNANRDIIMGNNDVVNVDSEEADRNWLRSNGTIHFSPFAQTGASQRVNVRQKNGGPQGVVWARGEIYSGNERLEGNLLTQAGQKSGGIMAPKSRMNYDMYQLRFEDLNIGGKDDDAVKARMPGGYYSINEAPIKWFVGQEEHQESVRVLSHIDPATGVRTNYYHGKMVSNNPGLIFPDDWNTDAKSSDKNGVVYLGTGPEGHAMTYNFETNEFVAASSETVYVDGSLSISSGLDGNEPKLRLLSNGSSVGVLKAKGDISIQGTISGGGALLAEGDLTLMANSQNFKDQGKATDVDADQNSGVVLFGQNVTMFGGNTHSMSFKGLIYAEHDFNVWGQAQVVTKNGVKILQQGENLELDTLELEGAVVARQGTINIADTKTINLKYNQTYLKALVKGMPDNRRRIRHVWSRAY